LADLLVLGFATRVVQRTGDWHMGEKEVGGLSAADSIERGSDRRALEIAIQSVTDPDHRLPGEPEEAGAEDDVDHWLATYTELVAYKEALIEVSQHQILRMERSAAREESLDVDDALLRAQLSRYRDRQRFWLTRRPEMASDGATPTSE
jgi:hypothetical protein